MVQGVSERLSRSGWGANMVGMAEDKGQATALQNYGYKKIWMSPWVRALTEMAQNSLDAGAKELRLVLMECSSLEETCDKKVDPLLLTYAADDGKGMVLDSFVAWFQQYGGSGKRQSGGGAPTAGGLGDGNTFLVHGARRTVARSSNFLSIIQGKSAVHLCAGCGFILPRTQVKYEGAWREVSLPCLRSECPLCLIDGMEAVAECPQEAGSFDLFPELGDLVRRVHASAGGHAGSDAAQGLVCTQCLGFHARAPLPPERAPQNAHFARGLELLVEERAIPVAEPVARCCELLGFEPLHLANEGRCVLVVPAADRQAALALLEPLGGAWIGAVGEPGQRVLLRTAFGSERLLVPLSGELLPRIC